MWNLKELKSCSDPRPSVFIKAHRQRNWFVSNLSAGGVWPLFYPTPVKDISFLSLFKVHVGEMWHQQRTHSISDRSEQDGSLFAAHLLAISSPEGLGNITSQQPRHARQTDAQSVPLCWQKAHCCVFFWLPCSGHSVMPLPGYINNEWLRFATRGEKNGPLCLAAKLLTCGAALADNNCDWGNNLADTHAWVRLKLKISGCGFQLSVIDAINRKLCYRGDGGRINKRFSQWASLMNKCTLDYRTVIWNVYAST